MCAAVSHGTCPEEVAQRKPGPVVQSPWLTTATRILRYYMSCPRPSPQLQHLAGFVMKVYSPMWFAIKAAPTIANGSLHLWNMIERSRYLPQDQRECVQKVIQPNAYFAHPENLLISMVADANPDIRTLGWRRLKKARRARADGKRQAGIRRFQIPEVNFEANTSIQRRLTQTKVQQSVGRKRSSQPK